MKTPSTTTRLIGHPVLAVPVSLLACALVLLSFQQSGLWIVALPVAFLARQMTLAGYARARYLAWKTEWDALDGDEPAPRRRAVKRPVLGFAALTLVVLFCASHLDDPLCRLTLGWLTILMLGGITAWLLRRARNGKSSQTMCVEICVRRPLMPVPDLRRAYRVLPAHCQKLLAMDNRQC